MDNNKIKSLLTSIVNSSGGTPKEWKEIASLINTEIAKNFATELRNLLRESPYAKQLIALDVLDYAVVEGNLPLHTQISTKDFITTLLTLLKQRDCVDIQYKILALIKKWGVRFETKKDLLPNFSETYKSLMNNGVIFPEKIESNYLQYVNEPVKEVVNINPIVGVSSSEADFDFPLEKIKDVSNQKETVSQVNANNNYGDVSIDLNPEHYPKKYRLFVSELGTLLNYIVLDNEMIDNADHKSKTVDDSIRELTASVRELSRNLQLAIENQIDNDDLMAICLGINEDLFKLFARYEALKAHKKPNGFVSCFHTDYAGYNLAYKKNEPDNVNVQPQEFVNKDSVGAKASDNQNLLVFNEEVVQANANPVTNTTQKTVVNKKDDPSSIHDVNDLFDLLNQK